MFIIPHRAFAILTCHNSISTRRIHHRRPTQSLACSTSNQNSFGSSLANRDWSSTVVISLPIERNWNIRGRLKWYRLGFVPNNSARQPCPVFEFEYRCSADDYPLQRSCIFDYFFVRPPKRYRLGFVPNSLLWWLCADIWRSCIFVNLFGSCLYNCCSLLCQSDRPYDYFSHRIF